MKPKKNTEKGLTRNNHYGILITVNNRKEVQRCDFVVKRYLRRYDIKEDRRGKRKRIDVTASYPSTKKNKKTY